MERRGIYSVLEGKPEGKIPLERPRHRWKDNIKKDTLFKYLTHAPDSTQQDRQQRGIHDSNTDRRYGHIPK